MKRYILAAGVAALAVTVPALADPGDKRGKERPGQVMKERGERAKIGEQRRQKVAQRQEKARDKAVERRSKDREKMVERRSKAREQAVERRFKAEDKVMERRSKMVEQRSKAREKAVEQRMKTREKAFERREKQAERAFDGRDLERMSDRRRDYAERRHRQLQRIAEQRRMAMLDSGWDDWNDRSRRGAWIDGCPPGLAKKAVACLPPGQAKKLVGLRVNALRDRIELRDLPSQLRYTYRDTPDYYYRYGNDYVYRVDRSSDVIRALLPLFGLGYSVGQQFPAGYSSTYLPSAYQPFYPSTPYSDYRYANGYVYEVDPQTGLIYDVDPMLGYGQGYGQMLPATYSAYNVPYEYRPVYYDTPNNHYRYAPGAIYQVDPQTSLITAVAALLTNGMTVGQQLPTGYGAYNVPYDYRNRYYDTQDDWYRYANGNIYRVDPTTQLVTAIVTSILT